MADAPGSPRVPVRLLSYLLALGWRWALARLGEVPGPHRHGPRCRAARPAGGGTGGAGRARWAKPRAAALPRWVKPRARGCRHRSYAQLWFLPNRQPPPTGPDGSGCPPCWLPYRRPAAAAVFSRPRMSNSSPTGHCSAALRPLAPVRPPDRIGSQGRDRGAGSPPTPGAGRDQAIALRRARFAGAGTGCGSGSGAARCLPRPMALANSLRFSA